MRVSHDSDDNYSDSGGVSIVVGGGLWGSRHPAVEEKVESDALAENQGAGSWQVPGLPQVRISCWCVKGKVCAVM